MSKAGRAARLGFWYTPFVGPLLRRMDRVLPAPAGFRGAYQPDYWTEDIVQEEGSLRDEARDIGLDYSIVRPAQPDAPMPIVIYSIPMVWGARHRSPPINYISRYLAAAGYCVIRVSHTDSDRHVFPIDVDDAEDRYGYVSENIRDTEKSHHRFLDTPFLIDSLESWSAGTGPLAGLLDLSRIGMSGHSFGGWTVYFAMGKKIGREGTSYADARLKAGIVYSPSPSIDPYTPVEHFEDVRAPMLHIAGSRDVSWSEPTLPEDRIWAFEKINAPEQYRLMLKGADHMTFPGGQDDRGTATPREKNLHTIIKTVSLVFWDAYLRDSDTAKDWLRTEFPKALGRTGKIESK